MTREVSACETERQKGEKAQCGMSRWSRRPCAPWAAAGRAGHSIFHGTTPAYLGRGEDVLKRRGPILLLVRLAAPSARS
eukprot:scaffold112691_cov28-Tisochrysis_lutea.AAC.3